MNTIPSGEFDPFSKEAIEAIETVEFLPDSIAFEHVMYDYRTSRASGYEYAHQPGQSADLDPIVIDPNFMISTFPVELENLFPDIGYTIEGLQITQVDSPGMNATSIAFYANGTSHNIFINQDTVDYATFNESLEPTSYTVSSEAVTGLLATFLYAKQYDPTKASQDPVQLEDSLIITQRDVRLDLTERIIMSLGNFSGSATIKTESIFDNLIGDPILAVLINQEFPDKSNTMSSLTLSEIESVDQLPTSVETTLHQNVVMIQDPTHILGKGKLENRYIEQRLIPFTPHANLISELIDPEQDHEYWAQTCLAFTKLIKAPMSIYANLDQQDY